MKNIFELEMAKPVSGNNIMIVDALNLAFRYKHAKKTQFADDYRRTVISLAKSYEVGEVIIACDWGRSTYRKNLYPEYKADREAKVALQTPEEQEEFKQFFTEFENTIDGLADEFTVLRYKGVEADDIAAYLTHYAFADTKKDIVLISSDKDWDLLLKDNVFRFSYVTRKEYYLKNWEERYPFPFEQALDVKVIVGGKDNVKGIEGIGEKRAHTLLEKYGSVFDLYTQLPNIPGKAKYIYNLNNSGDILLRNVELIDKITYCQEAIGKDNIKDINGKIKGIC